MYYDEGQRSIIAFYDEDERSIIVNYDEVLSGKVKILPRMGLAFGFGVL